MNIRIETAAKIINKGGIVAYPTEAVWGLGCDPFNQHAVERILALKQRKPEKGLILVAGSISQVEPLLQQLNRQQRQTVLASWPGPNTWIIPAAGLIPEWITGKHGSVAIRVSSHPLVQKLCLATGHVLVSTSANRTGRPAANSEIKTRLIFRDNLDYILSGKTLGYTQPSTITDAQSGKRIR